MAGLVPAIHALLPEPAISKDVDARNKPAAFPAPSWPDLFRPSTPYLLHQLKQNVDARNKSGHDGVLFANGPPPPRPPTDELSRTWMPGKSPRLSELRHGRTCSGHPRLAC